MKCFPNWEVQQFSPPLIYVQDTTTEALHENPEPSQHLSCQWENGSLNVHHLDSARPQPISSY